MEVGLPNISGSAGHLLYSKSNASEGTADIVNGAFNRNLKYHTNNPLTSGTAWGAYTTTFNASLSNTIYGNSTTVKPLSQSTLMLVKY